MGGQRRGAGRDGDEAQQDELQDRGGAAAEGEERAVRRRRGEASEME